MDSARRAPSLSATGGVAPMGINDQSIRIGGHEQYLRSGQSRGGGNRRWCGCGDGCADRGAQRHRGARGNGNNRGSRQHQHSGDATTGTADVSSRADDEVPEMERRRQTRAIASARGPDLSARHPAWVAGRTSLVHPGVRMLLRLRLQQRQLVSRQVPRQRVARLATARKDRLAAEAQVVIAPWLASSLRTCSLYSTSSLSHRWRSSVTAVCRTSRRVDASVRVSIQLS